MIIKHASTPMLTATSSDTTIVSDTVGGFPLHLSQLGRQVLLSS